MTVCQPTSCDSTARLCGSLFTVTASSCGSLRPCLRRGCAVIALCASGRCVHVVLVWLLQIVHAFDVSVLEVASIELRVQAENKSKYCHAVWVEPTFLVSSLVCPCILMCSYRPLR